MEPLRRAPLYWRQRQTQISAKVLNIFCKFSTFLDTRLWSIGSNAFLRKTSDDRAR